MASSTQFSIRSLLIAMVLTAVGLAAAMPVIRSWGTATQLGFVVNAAILAAGVCVFTTIRCVLRRRVERQAGEVVLRAPTEGNRFARLLQACVLLVFVLLLFNQAAGDAHRAGASQAFYASRPWFTLACQSLLAALLITNCWWGTGPGIVELAENGVIRQGTRFVPYAHFRTFRWNHYFPGTLILSSRDDQRTRIIVPHCEREHVQQFLSRKGLISSEVEDADNDSVPRKDARRRAP